MIILSHVRGLGDFWGLERSVLAVLYSAPFDSAYYDNRRPIR